MGNGKRTVDNNFNEARKQSKNIVIDLRRIKMHQSKANAHIKFYLSTPHRFKRVLVITKSKNGQPKHLVQVHRRGDNYGHVQLKTNSN